MVRLWAPAAGLRAPHTLSREREVWLSPWLGGRPHRPRPGILPHQGLGPRATRCRCRAGHCSFRGRGAPPHDPGPHLHPAVLGSHTDPANTPAAWPPGFTAPWRRAGPRLRSEGRGHQASTHFRMNPPGSHMWALRAKLKPTAEEHGAALAARHPPSHPHRDTSPSARCHAGPRAFKGDQPPRPLLLDQDSRTGKSHAARPVSRRILSGGEFPDTLRQSSPPF